jgi:hypothetical protein
MRTASVLGVGFCFCCGSFDSFPPMSLGTFEACPTDCVLIGPVTGLHLGIGHNAIWPNLFEAVRKAAVTVEARTRARASIVARGPINSFSGGAPKFQ